MSRGRVKTLLLTLLVVCSFLFAAQNWFGEGLWPQGQTPFVDTGFFSFIRNFFNGSGSEDSLSSYSALTDPEWITVNRQGSQKEQYYAETDAFSELNTFGDELLNALFSEAGIVSSTPMEEGAESYRAMLQTCSLCLHYRTGMPVELFGQVLSLPGSSLENIQVVDELLFLPSESSQKACTLAALDAQSNAGMLFEFTFDPERLRDMINRYTHEDSYLAYAFEINLGQESSAVPLSPMTVVSMEQTELPVLSVHTQMEPLTDTVLPLFGYNPATPKRYIEADDSQVFLERKSQLRITPDGVVEFVADTGTDGRNLAESTEMHRLLQALLNLAERIDYAAFEGENEAKLCISSDLTDLSRITMDYTCNGRWVRLSDGPAVVAELEGGNLVSYRQRLRCYQKTEETTMSVDVLSAIDELLESADGQSLNLPLDLRLYYRDTLLHPTVVAGWEAQ